MKQSIYYLYEYENYKQTKNVGFIKCIVKKEKTTIQIHGKGLDCDKFMDLELFLFSSDGETYEADSAGYVEGNQGVVNYKMTIEDMDQDKLYAYDGVILETVNHKKYVALWKQKEIRLESRIYKEQECETREEEIEIHECDVVEEAHECEEVEETCDVAEIEETSDVAEIEETCDVTEVEDSCEEDISKRKSKITYEKIDRYGIAKLSQREWKWASNSFLLHGYSNYKHLMLIREEDKLYLGIPGIYHRREEAAANSFGFPMFHPVTEEDVNLSRIERGANEQFGYWCRPVREQRGMEQRYDRCECTR